MGLEAGRPKRDERSGASTSRFRMASFGRVEEAVSPFTGLSCVHRFLYFFAFRFKLFDSVCPADPDLCVQIILCPFLDTHTTTPPGSGTQQTYMPQEVSPDRKLGDSTSLHAKLLCRANTQHLPFRVSYLDYPTLPVDLHFSYPT